LFTRQEAALGVGSHPRPGGGRSCWKRTAVELAERLACAAREFAAQESLQGTMEQVAGLAVEVVPGVDAAGLSVLDRTRNVVATDSFAGACEALQSRLGEGPAVARESAGDAVLVDLDDDRWPRLSVRLRRLGVRGLIACELAGERVTPARLNLYARQPLGPEAREVAALYAVHAAVAMSYASRVERMSVAMTTRERIGRAVGLLMHRHHLDADRAFGLLVRASQELNVKLRDLAKIVVETGIDGRETIDLARRAAKDAEARIDELRNRRTVAAPGGRPADVALADAERRARLAAARAVYRLGESAARELWVADEEA
jgi:hypothetical protein